MKNSKLSKKDLMNIIDDICLIALENDLKLPDEPGELINQNRKYIASFKMNISPQELTWDVTPIIDLIRFEGKDLLVKMLRSIHHDFATTNIEELTTALNKHEVSYWDYSTAVPNQLYILKALADAIGEIKPIT